jgi:anti-sigma-K factor RskA
MLELVPLYALDALEGQERLDFESHLDGCPDCRAELDGYRDVAAGLVPDGPADDETWDRIRESITGESTVVRLDERRPGGIWPWVAGVAAAAAVVLGLVLAGNLQDAGQLTPDGIEAAAAAAADEPGSFVGEFLVDDASVAQVVLTEDGRGFVIPTYDLAPLEEARTYQLWVINGSEDVISAGVLGAAPTPAMFTWTGDVAGFALTREVSGGVVSSEGDVVSVITDV